MSGVVVVTPSTGAAWATAWEQFEGIRKSMIPISLTNYDATTVPQIASGSWIEQAGSIYKWTSNDTITGSPSANVINYVTLVPSGAGASAILTPTWASGAPTWSDAYQGYFSGTTRYAGGCYYDGTNYKHKWIYHNRDYGPREIKVSLPLTGWSENAALSLNGYRAYWTNVIASCVVGVPVENGDIVTSFYSYCGQINTSTINVFLRHDGLTTDSATTMATNAHTAVGALTDSTITDPLVDTDNEQYYVAMASAAALTGRISGILITLNRIIR